MWPLVLVLVFLVSHLQSASLDPKIVGGTIVVDRSQFSYQALIRRVSTPICGGSILNETHILTAAHCVTHLDGQFAGTVMNASWFQIVLGNLDITDSPILRNVEEIVVHENWNPEIYSADIAIIKVTESFGEWTDDVRPINLTKTPVTSGICRVSGWGTTYDGGWIMNTDLLYADVPIVDWESCRNEYDPYVDDKMICAGNTQQDACQGDSGGPLVCNNEITGIVSFGDGCAVFPGVYVEVSKYINWIEGNSEENESSPMEASSTPIEASSTPIEASSTPIEASSTPMEASSTPMEASSTPIEASSTPIEASSTPIEASSTPIEASSTPIPNSAYNHLFLSTGILCYSLLLLLIK